MRRMLLVPILAALVAIWGCGSAPQKPQPQLKPPPALPAENPTPAPATSPPSKTDAKVAAIVSKLLDKPVVKSADRFIQDLGCDSLDCAEIIIEVEDTFKISIPDEGSEKLRTVGDLAAFVDKELKKKAK
ncbi:MAG TPA: acyl carrier protein [Planctomycetota bacterium]|nr:acyl carrier protein [Planctomycetota bacterium]